MSASPVSVSAVTLPSGLERYACQLRLRGLGGAEAQRRLARATCAVVGVGATGGAIAEALARAGVGRLRVIDRDVVELSNLQRQLLFDEQDAREHLPKAEAARRRLARVNSDVRIEARVADLDGRNALALLEGADLVLDGTDNFAARFVVNDACASLGVPWIYTGVVGTTVHGMPIVPGRTACFRCYLGAPPPPGAAATCETEGVLGPTVLVGAGFAAAEALKLLAAGREAAPGAESGPTLAEGLLVVDVWTRASRRIRVPRDPGCPTCAGRRDFLGAASDAEELCGQDAVLLRGAPPVDLGDLAARLGGLGQVGPVNSFLLRFAPREPAGAALTVFADGRALVRGTRDLAAARGLYARYIGA